MAVAKAILEDNMAEIEIFPDQSALVRAEAERVVVLTNAAIVARGRCLALP